MKTNKLWSILVMLMIALCATVTFTSCGDEEPDDEYSLIGTWKYSHDTEYQLITFNANGTGTLSKYKGNQWKSDKAFTYFYNQSTNKVTILENNSTGNTNTTSLTMVWSNKDNFTWSIDNSTSDDWGTTWTKYSGTPVTPVTPTIEKSNLIGNWANDYDDLYYESLSFANDNSIVYEYMTYEDNEDGVIAKGTYTINGNIVTATYTYVYAYGKTSVIAGFSNSTRKTVQYTISNMNGGKMTVLNGATSKSYSFSKY